MNLVIVSAFVLVLMRRRIQAQALIDADGKFGMRIESGLLVKKVKVSRRFSSDISSVFDSSAQQTRLGDPSQVWLGFERLTVVPIQTKMVKETTLSKDEIA